MISITGKPLNTFINDYRLEEALQLLIKKEKPLQKLHSIPALAVPLISLNAFKKDMVVYLLTT
jgi:AraC-like DNA-binding protein